MNILTIDPGTTFSAYTHFDGVAPHSFGKLPNEIVLSGFRNESAKPEHIYIEMIASYGMPVGKEVFDTVLFIGRLLECCKRRNIPCTLVYRKEVKMHHCGQTRAKDSNIRQALIDRFGAPGTKNAQGKTYGLKADTWQAFALAVYAWDTFHGK